jgi:hypothetical protein
MLSSDDVHIAFVSHWRVLDLSINSSNAIVLWITESRKQVTKQSVTTRWQIDCFGHPKTAATDS